MTDKEFLLAVKQYIIETEECIDGEWGACRSFEEILNQDDSVPEIYKEVMERLEDIK